ncbi:hypothetical protein RYA99_22255 [Pseudomonas syringae pv. actinidifoliorum]|nr:hypothetical protein [Pseudomonas syringae pv. actinidifoliorum]MDU8522018.1 hypothetical protein [Pseudomonas syringae pv. actinidifoliorum]MDU8528893.1 hypothetical protein [Pseudomonas syringae pv. actinidifoliorum]
MSVSFIDCQLRYFKAGVVSNEYNRIERVVLTAVKRLCGGQRRKLTFGQIYRELVRSQSSVPAIGVCVTTVDTLVREGLLTSIKTLEPDRSFPYTQHLISGLTEIGAASLMDTGAGGTR